MDLKRIGHTYIIGSEGHSRDGLLLCFMVAKAMKPGNLDFVLIVAKDILHYARITE